MNIPTLCLVLLLAVACQTEPVKKVFKSVPPDDIQLNEIPGSSDLLASEPNPKKMSNATLSSIDEIKHFKNVTNQIAPLNTTTASHANVFKASPVVNVTDPLIGNAQSPNPQIAMILRNNPRLQMLARQNPMIAQQLMQNPGLLRDPAIQRAIQAQLNPGQQQSLLGQLGQMGMGLGQALNPLGIGGGLGRQQNANPGYANQGFGNNGFGPGRMSNQGPRANQFGNQMNPARRGGGLQQNNLNNAFGLPQGNHALSPGNQDTLRGGYYGNNGNYQQPKQTVTGGSGGGGGGDNGGNEAEEGNAEGGGEEGGGEAGGEGEAGQAGNGEEAEGEDNTNQDAGNQDYDAGNNGGGEDGGQQNASEDGQQNPAEDPDIQQMQNFGGGVTDNFPEGLFPPGLLSKEDINEIRKQQEKQQKDEQERQRRQQQGNQSPDYDNTGGEDGTGAEQGGNEASTNEGTPENGNVEQPNNNEFSDTSVNTPHGYNKATNPDEGGTAGGGIVTPTPPAYRNAYQPVQPHQPKLGRQHVRVPQEPLVDYEQQHPQNGLQNAGGQHKIPYGSGVEYDQHSPVAPNNEQHQPQMLNTFSNQNPSSLSNLPPYNHPHGPRSMPNTNEYEANLMNRGNVGPWTPQVNYDRGYAPYPGGANLRQPPPPSRLFDANNRRQLHFSPGLDNYGNPGSSLQTNGFRMRTPDRAYG